MNPLKQQIIEILEYWDEKTTIDEIADQIQSETLKKVIEMLPKEIISGDMFPVVFHDGYNQCLQDLKSKLNKL